MRFQPVQKRLDILLAGENRISQNRIGGNGSEGQKDSAQFRHRNKSIRGLRARSKGAPALRSFARRKICRRGIVAPRRGSCATETVDDFRQRLSLLRGQFAQPQKHGAGHMPLRGIPARGQAPQHLPRWGRSRPGAPGRALATLAVISRLRRSRAARMRARFCISGEDSGGILVTPLPHR